MNEKEIEYVESLISLSQRLPVDSEIMITERQLFLLEKYMLEKVSSPVYFRSSLIFQIPKLNGHPIVIVNENYFEEMDFINQSS